MAGWTSPLDYIDQQNWPVPQPAAPQGQSGWLMAGAKAGLHDMASFAGGTGQWLGKVTGIEPLERAGQALSDSQSEAANAERPDLNVAPWREGGAPVLPWLGYQAVRNLPYIAATAVAGRFMPSGMVPNALKSAGAYVPEFMGGGGAALGEQAGYTAAKKGVEFARNVTAGAVAGAPMAIGSMQQEINERVKNGGDPYTWGEAVGLGAKAVPYAAMEALGPAQAFGIAKQLKNAKGIGDVGKIALKGAAAGAIEEMPQEAAQTAMEQSYRTDLPVSEKAQNIIDGALTGAAVGGVFGGAAGGVSGTRSIMRAPPQNVDTESLERSTAEVDPTAAPPVEPELPMDLPHVDPTVAEAPPAPPTAPPTISAEEEPELPLGMPPTKEAEEVAVSPRDYLLARAGISPGRAATLKFFSPDRLSPDASPEDIEKTAVTLAQAWDKLAPANQAVMRATGMVDRKGRTLDAINAETTDTQAEIERLKTQIAKNPGLKKTKAMSNLAKAERNLDDLTTSLEELNTARAKWQGAVEAYTKSKGTTNGLSSETSRANAGPDVNAASLSQGQEGSLPAEGRQGQQQSAAVEEGESPALRQGQSRVEEASVEGTQLPADAWGNGVGEKPNLDTSSKPVTLDEMFAEPSKNTFNVAGEVDPLAGKSEKARKLIEASRAYEEARKSKPNPLIEDQYETPEFKNWFGQSKAVDDQGAPLRVYTGTSKDVDFSKFRAPKNGVWFSENPNEASQYAVENDSQNFKYEDGGFKRTNTASRVIPAHLSMQNPMVVEDLPQEMQGENYRKAQGQYFAKLKSQGYDGLIMGKPGSRTFVAFNPTQIKSAVSNNGQFSTTDGNISKRIDTPAMETSQDQALADHINSGAKADEVLDQIANDTARPEYRSLVQALKRFKINPTIKFAKQSDSYFNPFLKPGQRLKGEYDSSANAISLYAGDDLHRTVLHEAVHAATVKALATRRISTADMKALMEAAHEALGTSKADLKTLDVNEFVAEAYTNPEFREQLKAITPTGSKVSLWEKFKNFVMKALRLPTSARTLLDEVMDQGERVMQDNADIVANDQAYEARYGKQSHFPLIEEEDRKASTAVTMARRAVDKVWQTIDPKGGLTARLAIQRQLLKGSSWGHIAEHFDHMWNSKEPSKGPLHKLDRGQTFQNTFKAHLGDLFRDVMSKLTLAHPRAREIISHFAYLSSLRVNPKLKADEHTWLTPEEHARLDEKIIPEANRMYAELKGLTGGVKAYEAAIAHNQIQEYALVAMQLYRQMKYSDLYSSLLKKFPVSPEDKFAQLPTLHNNITDASKFWLDQMNALEKAISKKDKEVDTLAGKRTKSEQAKADREKKSMKNAIDAVHQKQMAAKQYPYFHLMRDGDTFVAFKLKRLGGKDTAIDPAALEEVNKVFAPLNVYIEKEQNQDQVFIRLPTEYEAIKAHEAAMKLRERGMINDDKEAMPTHGYRADAPPTYIMTNEQMGHAIDALRAAFDPPADASPETKKLMGDLENHAVNELRNYLIDMMPDMALAKVNVKRENKPGFSKDMEKAFARRAHIGVNALSNIAASDKIAEALREMKDGLLPSKEDAKNPTDVFVKQNVYREAMLRQLDHAKASDVDGDLVDVGRALNSFWHLAFSPSYALINSAQVFVLLWPELSKHMGYVKAGKAIMKVMPEALNILSEAMKAGYVPGTFNSSAPGLIGKAKEIAPKLGTSILRASDAGITQSVLEKAYGIDKSKGKNLEAREQELLAAALRGGIDLNSAARELARISEGLSDKSADAVFRVGASFGQYSETFTRLVAALAAHDVYKSKVKSGEKTVGELTKKSLPDYIDHVIKQSMLDYAETNTARGIGRHGWAGSLSPLMFSFMNYQFQVLEKLYREMHTAIGLQKDFDPAQQKAARRFLLGHAVALTALTGTLGLPAAGFLAGMVNRLKELFGDDKDVRENYREFLASVFGKDMGEIIAHGLPNAMGASISQRAGEQNIIPFTGIMESRQKFVDGVKDWAFSMGGAPLNAIANFVQGAHEVAEGNTLEGMRKAVPVFLKGPIAAYQLTRDGYVDNKGNALPLEAGAADILATFLGFTPPKKAEYQEQRKFMADRKGLEMARGSNIRKHITSAIEAGDQETAQKWMTEANALAQVSPERDIRPSIRSSVVRRAKERAMAEATHTPLGLSPKGGMTGTDYANW